MRSEFRGGNKRGKEASKNRAETKEARRQIEKGDAKLASNQKVTIRMQAKAKEIRRARKSTHPLVLQLRSTLLDEPHMTVQIKRRVFRHDLPEAPLGLLWWRTSRRGRRLRRRRRTQQPGRGGRARDRRSVRWGG
jgi:hypothetical protein